MESCSSFNGTLSDEESSIFISQLFGDQNSSFGMQTLCLEDANSYLWSQEPHFFSYSMDASMSLIDNSSNSTALDLEDNLSSKRKNEEVVPLEILKKKPRISKKVSISFMFYKYSSLYKYEKKKISTELFNCNAGRE